MYSTPSGTNICHEHPTTEESFRLISRLSTSDELQSIQASIAYGASSGTIWSKLGTVIPPQQLACVHHELGDAGQTETQQLLNAVKHWKRWMIVPTFADMAHAQMERCRFIHSRVDNLQFTNEVLVMEHTFFADHFGLLLIAIIAEDWEARNQLLAWGFLSDRTSDSFKSFPWPSVRNCQVKSELPSQTAVKAKSTPLPKYFLMHRLCFVAFMLCVTPSKTSDLNTL
jgi:hypothetical protein